MTPMLSQGSVGYDVAVLQVQLNGKLVPSPFMDVDGIFGPITRAAVIKFQQQAKLKDDGIAGPKTQAALALGPALSMANHAVRHIPQPTSSTCWAASTAMMTNSTVPAVRAKTPAAMLSSNGGLLNGSGGDNGVTLGQAYGAIHHLRCRAPMSWTVGGLVGLIKKGPVMFDLLWKSNEYAAGSASPGHMIVINAVISDNNNDGKGTHLHVLDPWAPNQGKVYWKQYFQWINELPTLTYRIFERG